MAPSSLPFDDRYIKDLVDRPDVGRISTWIDSQATIGILRHFKHNEIDGKKRYQSLQQGLGQKEQDWNMARDGLVRLASRGLSKGVLGEGELDIWDAQRLRLIDAAQRIVQCEEVPGSQELVATRYYTPYCFRAAFGLILSAVHDLQHQPHGHFSSKLGGRPVMSVISTGIEPPNPVKIRKKRRGPRGGKAYRGVQRQKWLKRRRDRLQMNDPSRLWVCDTSESE
ncbi:hypothetical protein LTR97_002858 [Elasticomyces elasticus]|uniref:Uncharacterized protein n=1 Tax=Elasticomyces elasticus TaxID=574655 RepID=A0AAN7WDF0_9PEZI|nr:hypothetical protein LTR97_002858 [Elasticomyces elasticus]